MATSATGSRSKRKNEKAKRCKEKWTTIEKEDENPIKKSVWDFPKIFTNNPQAPQSERPNFKIALMMQVWRSLHSRTKERLFIACHLSVSPFHENYWWFSTELVWIMRQVFVEINLRDPQAARRLEKAFDTLAVVVYNRGNETPAKKEWFEETGLMTSIESLVHSTTSAMLDALRSRKLLMVDDPETIATIMAVDFNTLETEVRPMFKYIFDICIKLFFYWSESQDKKIAMRKLNAKGFRYSDEDRRKILDALEKETNDSKNKNVSDPMYYFERLLNHVGRQKFEILVFGRLKTCGWCGTTNRQKYLWTCKLCAVEGIRPKQRYCNKHCQSKDWPKHRELHKQHAKNKVTKEVC